MILGELTEMPDQGPSIKQTEEGWWWADEVWFWHGPYDSEREATWEQNVYISLFEDPPPPLDTAAD